MGWYLFDIISTGLCANGINTHKQYQWVSVRACTTLGLVSWPNPTLSQENWSGGCWAISWLWRVSCIDLNEHWLHGCMTFALFHWLAKTETVGSAHPRNRSKLTRPSSSWESGVWTWDYPWLWRANEGPTLHTLQITCQKVPVHSWYFCTSWMGISKQGDLVFI